MMTFQSSSMTEWLGGVFGLLFLLIVIDFEWIAKTQLTLIALNKGQRGKRQGHIEIVINLL